MVGSGRGAIVKGELYCALRWATVDENMCGRQGF